MPSLELLAPARDYTSAVAAVDCGADALYIGGSSFGARKAAANRVADIARVVEYAHQFGVKVYATFNTVIFDNELSQAQAAAEELVSAGVDALIVQDMAVARMGLPIELHASTQMCNMTPEGVRFLEEVGFSRVVLERALSREKIEAITSSTNVEIEAFIHGAICVGHSGRCLLSRSMSNRSGNRGECSQPCRMTYDLLDERGRKILSEKHLLSVKDLNLSARIGEMIDSGVTSFKIEGRLKDIGYTKNIVAHYRALLDREIALRKGFARSSCGESKMEFEPNPIKSFTRGESEYLWSGQTSALASFDTPKSMGEALGEVEQVRRGEAFRIDATLAAGDGICFLTPEGLRGTNINKVEGNWVYPNRMDGIAKGVAVYRNFDKSFAVAMERSRTKRKIAVRATYSASESCATLTVVDTEGISATNSICEEFSQAQNAQKMSDTIFAQLNKCGDTIFDMKSIEVESGSADVFLPSSKLATLRRETLAKLINHRLSAIKVGGQHFVENPTPRYPNTTITAEGAVTNRVAMEFYRDHGVATIAPSWECSNDLRGALVMESSYCIRHEIGECLREGSQLRGDLYLHHGADKFRVETDCAKCQMNIYKL